MNFSISILLFILQLFSLFDCYILPVPYIFCVLIEIEKLIVYAFISTLILFGIFYLSFLKKPIFKNPFFHILLLIHFITILICGSESSYATRFLSSKNFASQIPFLFFYIPMAVISIFKYSNNKEM